MAANTLKSSTLYKMIATFTPMTTLPERLQKILSEMEGPDHGKQSRLAVLADCKRATITHYMKNAGSEIGYEYAKNIADALNYSVDWLIMGRGPERVERTAKTVMITLQYVDAQEAEILTLYRASTPFGKNYILDSARLTEKLPAASLISASAANKPE